MQDPDSEAPYIQMVDDFPQELIDYILDFLHDDKATLALCSLVDRRWLFSSRYHLFRTMHIMLQDDIPWNLPCFMQFLDGSPHIGSLVQDLVLVASLRASPRSAVCPDHVLPVVLEKLPRLLDLSLFGSKRPLRNECACDPALRDCHLPQDKHFNLRSLTLNHVHHGSPHCMFALLNLFSNISTLLMVSDILQDANEPWDPTDEELQTFIREEQVTPQLRIQNGNFYSFPSLVLLRILSTTPSAHTLRTIRTLGGDLRDLKAIAKLIRSCPNIHEVDLCPTGVVLTGDIKDWAIMDFSSCRTLEKFALRLDPFLYMSEGSEYRVEPVRQQYRDVISTLPKFIGAVPHLVLGIYADDGNIGVLHDYYDWDHLQSALLGLRHLRSVTFEIPDRDGEIEDFTEFENYIMSSTTGLQERCPVRVEKVGGIGWGWFALPSLTQLGLASYEMDDDAFLTELFDEEPE